MRKQIFGLSWLVAVVLMSALSSFAQCLPAPTGLIGWWPGDGNANNLLGTNNGSFQGTATAATVGYVGNAFTFDGTNGYVQIPNSPILQPTNFTIECWVQFSGLDSSPGTSTSPAGDQYIVFKQNSRSTDFEGFDLSKTRVSGSDYFRFLVVSTAGQTAQVLSSSTISTGVWYHVAAVRGANFLQLYVNGSLQRQTNVTFAQNYGNQPLFLGTSGQPSWDHKLKGNLDEVALYNRPLNSNEIAAIATSGASGKCKGPSIVQFPQSLTATLGSNATFSVLANGWGSLSYQWRFNGTNLPAATNAALTLTNVQFMHVGNYSVVISNALNVVTSPDAALAVIPNCSALSSGLVGWWPAEASLSDLSGTMTATAPYGIAYAPGFVGQAFDFDGSLRRVSISDGPQYYLTNGLTLEAWVYPRAYGGFIIFRGDIRPGLDPYFLDTYTTGQVKFAIVADNSNYTELTAPLALNQWTHVAATWSRTTGLMKIYTNGSPAALVSTTVIPLAALDPGQEPGIGIGNHSGTIHQFPFNGLIDEPAIYSRALTQSEIQAIYFAGQGGKCFSPTPPAIFRQPHDTVFSTGSALRLIAETGGTQPLSHQWFYNGDPLANGGRISGADSTSLIITNALIADSGSYWYVVTNSLGAVTSAVATVLVGDAPVLQNISPQTVLLGANATFTAVAVGAQPLEYRWQFNSVHLTNDARISGATNDILTISNVTMADAGIYVGGVANQFGFMSTPTVLTVVEPPSISIQPAGGVVPAATNFSFTVTTLGTAPLVYQWYLNQSPLPQATNTTLALTNVQAANAGDFTVVITNLYGSVTSAVATLVVTPVAPVFTLHPTGRTVTKGAEVAFNTTAKGSEPISYQWLFNGTNISGATAPLFILTNAQYADTGLYAAQATNIAGVTNSAEATLTITPPPGFLWTRAAVGAGGDLGRSLARDAQGNILVAGTFAGTISFGTNTLISTNSSVDIFVAKYDPAGQIIWARSGGSSGTDNATGIAVDGAGNVIVVGQLAGIGNFSGQTITNIGGADVFVAKYDPNGTLLWVTNFGGTSTDIANAVTTDAAGNIFITGSFNGTGFFGGTIISNTLNGAAFTARLNPDGSVNWVRASSGSGSASGNGISVDSQGNVLVAGSFSPSFTTFGTVALTNSVLVGASASPDVFVAKYTADGNVTWAIKAGGTSSDAARGIAVDGGGNSYIIGEYNVSATFGSTTLTEYPGFNQSPDVFVMKCDPFGSILWAKRAGGTSTDTAGGVAVDSGGNVFITGSYAGTGNFGGAYYPPGVKTPDGGYFGGTNINSAGGTDAFVAMLTTAGEYKWALRAGGTSTDAGRTVIADNSGSLFLSGSFSSTATFGHQSFPSSGGTDFFLSKLAAFDADAAAALVAQPASQTIAAGSTITLSAGVVAPGPISWQWLFNGANIPGATNLSLTLVNLIATNSGAYSVNITTPNGNLATTNATLTVVTEPDFLWAKHIGGGGNDECLAVAADSSGNTYAAGYFSGTTDFGGTNLTSSGGEDIFVSKFDAAQNLVWLRQIGGTNHDRANALALDNAGNVIVAGQFSATADFGGTNLTSFGSNDVFLAKFDSTGALLWARQAGSTNADVANSLAVSTNGDIALAGSFQRIATFDGISLTNKSLANAPSSDVFVARYSADGQLLWAKGAGGTSEDRARSVAFDGAGNILVAGGFNTSIVFDTGSITSTRKSFEIFVAKYGATGSVFWARSPGTSATDTTMFAYDDEATALAVEPGGSFFLTGYFQSTGIFGTNTVISASTNAPDVFLAKYDDQGTVIWTRIAGGLAVDSGLALAADNSGDVLLAGTFSGPAQFGGKTMTGIDGADAFAVMYDATGTLVKARQLGGMGDDAALAAVYDGRGNLVLGGFHTGPAAAGVTPMPGAGGRDAFMAKLSLYDPDLAPLITTQLRDLSVAFGKTLDLAVAVTSGTTPSYQWLFNNLPLAGATNSTLRLPNFQYAAVGDYAVIITNAFGAVTSSVATVTVEIFPEFPWLQRAGGTGDDQAFALVMDAQTNLYMAGHFSGTATFTNGFYGTNVSLVSTGLTDIFLAKYNLSGKLLWVRRAGGASDEAANSLAVDSSGNVFMTGSFRSTQARFDNSVITNASNNIISDIFIAKYSPEGNAIWAKRAGGVSWDAGRSIATDAEGNAYITGFCYYLANFDGIALTNASVNAVTNYFIAKYDSNGVAIWARNANSVGSGDTTAVSASSQAFCITVDANTNVLVTGNFYGTINFGDGILVNNNSSSEGGSIFLGKYDRNGNLLWARKGASGGAGVGLAVRADGSGNIYASSYRPSFSASPAAFLTRYDSNGFAVWTRSVIQGNGQLQCSALALDSDGNIMMAGGVTGSMTFDGTGLNTAGFVSKHRPDGVPLWVQRAGVWCYGVVPDAAGGAYLAGRYSGTGLFGPNQTNTLASIGGNDIFLVKLGVKPPTATPQAFVNTIATDAGTTLQVTTTGTGPFAYQWRFNGTNIPGATSSSYSLTGLKWTNAGLYSVSISNTAGSFVSAPTALNVIPKLYSEASGNTVKLTWDGEFTLQAALSPAGPFSNLPDARSPYFYSTTEPLRFFRLSSEPFALRLSTETDRSLSLSGAGISGYNFVLLSSTNLSTWTPLATNVSPLSFRVTNNSPQQFFRTLMAQ